MNYKNKRVLYLGCLLLAYFLVRVIFQQLPSLKLLFIYPTGIFVNAFLGGGTYINGEWLYIWGQTKLVLGESCSGTTFFSLLVAYLLYSSLQRRTSFVWLAVAFPITLIANSMRVVISIYAHNYLPHFGAAGYGDAIHVIAGTITFLSCFLLVVLLIERTGVQFHNEKSTQSC